MNLTPVDNFKIPITTKKKNQKIKNPKNKQKKTIMSDSKEKEKKVWDLVIPLLSVFTDY